MNPTSRMNRVPKFRPAHRDAATALAKSMWLKMTPPKMVPRALVSRGSIVTRRVGSRASAIQMIVSRRGAWRAREKSFICPAGSSQIRQPRRILLVLAFDDVEEGLLKIRRDRAAPSGANLAVVDFTDRRQLCRRAGEKRFVRGIELVARQGLL